MCAACARPRRLEGHPALRAVFLQRTAFRLVAPSPADPSPLEFAQPTLAQRTAYARKFYSLQLRSQPEIAAAAGAASASSSSDVPESAYDRSIQAARCLGLLPRPAYLALRSAESLVSPGLEPRRCPAPLRRLASVVMSSHAVAAPLRAVVLGLVSSVRPSLQAPPGSLFLAPDLAGSGGGGAATLVSQLGDGSLEVTRLRPVLPRSLRQALLDSTSSSAAAAPHALAADLMALHVPSLPRPLRYATLLWAAQLALSAPPIDWAFRGSSSCSGWDAATGCSPATAPAVSALLVTSAAAATDQNPAAAAAAGGALSASTLTLLSLRHLLGVASHAITGGLAIALSDDCSPSKWAAVQDSLRRVPSLPEIACLLAQAALLQSSEARLRPLLSDPLSFPSPARPLLHAASAAAWYLEAAQGLLDISAVLDLTASPERDFAEIRLGGGGSPVGAASCEPALLALCQGQTSRLPRHLAERLVCGTPTPIPPPQWRHVYDGRLFHALAQTLGADGVSGLSAAAAELLVPNLDACGEGPGAAVRAARRAIARAAGDFAPAAESLRADPLLLLPPHAAALLRASPAAESAFSQASSELLGSINLAAVLRDLAAARAVSTAGPLPVAEELEVDGEGEESEGETAADEAVPATSPLTRAAGQHRPRGIEPAPVTLVPPDALLSRLVCGEGGLLEVGEPDEQLPIAEHCSALLWAISQCSFSLVLTETGSGKTVRLVVQV